MSEINMTEVRPNRIKLNPLTNKYRDNYNHNHMLKFDTAKIGHHQCGRIWFLNSIILSYKFSDQDTKKLVAFLKACVCYFLSNFYFFIKW